MRLLVLLVFILLKVDCNTVSIDLPPTDNKYGDTYRVVKLKPAELVNDTSTFRPLLFEFEEGDALHVYMVAKNVSGKTKGLFRLRHNGEYIKDVTFSDDTRKKQARSIKVDSTTPGTYSIVFTTIGEQHTVITSKAWIHNN